MGACAVDSHRTTSLLAYSVPHMYAHRDGAAVASASLVTCAMCSHRCKLRGVPVLIDGAHAIGMLDLDMERIGYVMRISPTQYIISLVGTKEMLIESQTCAHKLHVNGTFCEHRANSIR